MKEFIYTLFIFSGILKSVIPHLKYVPDITGVTLILIFVLILSDAILNRIQLSIDSIIIILFLILYYIIMIISATYSPSINYKYEKLALFTLNIIAFCSPILWKGFNVEIFFKWVVKMGLFIMACFLIYYPIIKLRLIPITKEEYDIYKGMYLNAGLIGGLLIVILNILPVKDFNTSLIFTFFLAIVLLVSGARGPLLFSLLVIFISKIFSRNSYVLQHKIKLKWVFTSIVAITVLSVSILLILRNEDISELIEKRIARFNYFISGDKSGSIDERLEHLTFTENQFSKNEGYRYLTGFGAGSYSILKNGEDRKDHPHNFILESFFDTGFIGTFILSIFILFVVYLSFSKRHSKMVLFIMAYIFLNALKSSSIIETRILFAMFAICYLSAKRNKVEV